MNTRKPTEARRLELADAALAIVAERGIAALSTSALAEAVGLTTGALFKHYATRDDLLVGMADRVVELLNATFPEPALPPLERLRALAAARLDLVSGRAGILQLVQSDQFSLALPPAAVARLRGAVADTRAFVEAAWREAQAAGVARADVPAPALALLFMGALQMTAMSRRLGAPAAGPAALDALLHLTTPTEAP